MYRKSTRLGPCPAEGRALFDRRKLAFTLNRLGHGFQVRLLGGKLVDKAGLIGGTEAVVDVDDGYAGGAAIQHGEKRGYTAETGTVADAGGNTDDRTRNQATDHTGQGALHARDHDRHVGLMKLFAGRQQT